jgi:3-deoxy-D-manno-octulosonic-acid transferase
MSLSQSLSLALYKRLMGAAHVIAPSLLQRRVKRGKEDSLRWREKLGQTDYPRPEGPLVWFHGVSVGESLSALPIIVAMATDRPDLNILLTSATTTSADILAKRLPKGVIHQFAPIDTPQAIKAFLDHWHPDLAVFIESDIWPTQLRELTQRNTPHVLLSARITEKTYKGWQRFKSAMRPLLTGYALVMAQDKASEDRLKSMGVTVGPRANLKTLGAPLPVDTKALSELKKLVGKQFIYFAASTHYGEDSLIAKALEPALWGGDLLILAPRHPIRAAEIRLDLEAFGLKVAQRSKSEPVTSQTHIYLADTLGELGLFFSVAGITIMGGSFLEDIGGHNPLEAARLGKSVITGPDISNWSGIYADLLDAEGGFRVKGTAELGFLLSQLRQHPEAVKAADGKALKISRREADTLDVVWTALEPLLPAKTSKTRHGD